MFIDQFRNYIPRTGSAGSSPRTGPGCSETAGALTHIADEADARVVLVGDRRQLPAYVEADHHRADDYYLAEVPVADHREGGPGDTEQLREDGNAGVSVGSAAVTGPHSLLRALIGCSCKELGGSRETAWLGRRFYGPRDTAAPGSVGAV